MTTIARARRLSTLITCGQRAWLLALLPIAIVIFALSGAVAGAIVAVAGCWDEWLIEWRCA